MCVGQTDIGRVYPGIEGAEAERAVGLLDRDRIVVLPSAYDRTVTEREGRRTEERERPIECGECSLKVVPGNGDHKAGSGKRGRIVDAGSDRTACVAQSGDPRLLLHSAPQVALLMAKGDECMRCGKIGVQLGRPAEQ